MVERAKDQDVVFNQIEKVKILLFDLLLLFLTFYFVTWFRFSGQLVPSVPWLELALISIFQLAAIYIFGGYELRTSKSNNNRWIAGGLAFLATALFAIAYNYLGAKDKAGLYGRGVLLGSLSIFYLLSVLVRIFFLARYSKSSRKENWLILTCDEFFGDLSRDLEKIDFVGLSILNCDVASPGEIADKLQSKWDGLILAVDKKIFHFEIAGKTLMHVLMDLRFSGLKVVQLNEFYESVWRKVPAYFLSAEWFATQGGFMIVVHPIRQRFKRLFDICISLSLIVLTLPLVLLAMLIVYLESPGPVIFYQLRTGKGSIPFTIFKLRSMILNAESPGEAKWAIQNDSRILKCGNLLRKTRIDELPQLLNVLKGEMSFVGPRPERPEFIVDLERKIPFYNMRHLIQPGLTGWAQVMYPYGASIEDAREKLQYDLYYIKNHSVIFDIQILLRTIRVVFLGAGR